MCVTIWTPTSCEAQSVGMTCSVANSCELIAIFVACCQLTQCFFSFALVTGAPVRVTVIVLIFVDPYSSCFFVFREYYPQNIMFDKRVHRGNSYAAMVIPAGTSHDTMIMEKR